MLAEGTTLGPYKILSVLGAGGMGEVYRGRDMRLGRDVAIKVIPPDLARDPERIKRFEQEARAAGALNHPNVCAIYDLGTHEGAPFVVMELLEGETLRERLSEGAIPVRKAIDYAAQAAHGLAAAHEKGIVHRDLKPENLFVTRDGRVRVLDFGLAKLTRPEVLAQAGEKPLSIAATETGAILGTAGYMSPEQVRGQAADHRSDLFALGAILYELLAGKRAFQGASYVETLNAILNEEPAPLSDYRRDLPPGLENLVRRCLEKSPQERFQSARDLAFDLEVSQAPGAGKVAGAAAPRAAIRTRTVVAAILLAFFAGVVVAGAVLLGISRPQRASSQVTYQRLTVERGLVWSARFAPSGETVFLSASWDGRLPEIFETRPGFPISRAVGVQRADLRSISRNGTMAVTLGHAGSPRLMPSGTLAQVPMGGGAPRSILENVVAADWTPDGSMLAVAHEVGGKVRLELPPGHALYETAGQLGYVRVSPDGKRLAFVENPVPSDTRGSVVIMNAAGRIAARTVELESVTGLVWSPDGREVWFSSSQDQASFAIWALRPDGRQRVVQRWPGVVWLKDAHRNGQVLLTSMHVNDGIRGRRSPTDEERELGWLDRPVPRDISRDGRTLLFEEQGIGGGLLYAVCLRGMDGSAPVRLGQGRACALSPDGKWALAVHYGTSPRLVLLPTGAGDSTSLPRGGIQKYVDARWLPDGKNVVFVGSEVGQASRTYIQDLEGGPPRAITPAGIAGSVVSPDGRLVAALAADRRLFVCPMSGGEPRPVAQLLPNEMVVQWTTDGRFLYVAQFGGSTCDVTRIARETGTRTPWRTFSMSDPAGLGFSRLVLTPDGRAYAYRYSRRLDDLYLVTGLR
jgi:WD40 repeat protein